MFIVSLLCWLLRRRDEIELMKREIEREIYIEREEESLCSNPGKKQKRNNTREAENNKIMRTPQYNTQKQPN